MSDKLLVSSTSSGHVRNVYHLDCGDGRPKCDRGMAVMVRSMATLPEELRLCKRCDPNCSPLSITEQDKDLNMKLKNMDPDELEI